MKIEKKSLHKKKCSKKFKDKTTIGEILETAASFEEVAFKFYSDLKNKVSQPLRRLVQELADEEKRHVELFKSISQYPQVPEQMAQLIKTLPSDQHFSDYIKLPNLNEFSDDKAIIQYAIGREQAAMQQYMSLAEETPPGPIQDLFRYLAHEELRHKRDLEKRYQELLY
jgi:rubrerythrin